MLHGSTTEVCLVLLHYTINNHYMWHGIIFVAPGFEYQQELYPFELWCENSRHIWLL